ncbi:MAG: adenylate/guanylate cyclase domain-containing protein [Ginsengibacter sp.]
MDEIDKKTKTNDHRVRQLAAIMFADMTGYTALMQEDEQRATILRERQRHILATVIPAYKGKILQYFGDGTLSIFDSAINAVQSGIEIQHELQKDPKVLLRIGIHSGEIVYDSEGVYGDSIPNPPCTHQTDTPHVCKNGTPGFLDSSIFQL